MQERIHQKCFLGGFLKISELHFSGLMLKAAFVDCEVRSRFIKQGHTCSMIHGRSSHQRCSKKKMFLKISQISQENTCAQVSFLLKL